MLELIAKFRALVAAARAGDVWAVVEILHEFIGIALGLRKQPMMATADSMKNELATALRECEQAVEAGPTVAAGAGAGAIDPERWERIKKIMEFAALILRMFI